MKLQTGAKQGVVATIRRKIKRAFRPQLARAAKPFDWTLDPQVIQNRLNAIGPIPIKNQFQSDSCGGQAGSYWLGVVMAQGSNSKYSEVSAKSVYAPIAYPGGGTTDVDLQREIMNVGAVAENIVPSYRPDGTTDEVWMTDKSWMTTENMIIALKDAGWIEVTVQNDINAIAEAERDYGAIIWHIQSMFNAYAPENWLSSNPQLPPVNPTEGHLMCAHNAQLVNGVPTIIALQSWGSQVPNGVQNFTTQTYIGSPYLVDIFTFVPKTVPHPIIPGQTIPNPQVITWQQRLINYLVSFFGV